MLWWHSRASIRGISFKWLVNRCLFTIAGCHFESDWQQRGTNIDAVFIVTRVKHRSQHRVAHRVHSACVSWLRTPHWHVSFWTICCCSGSQFDTRQALVLSTVPVVRSPRLCGCTVSAHVQIRQTLTARDAGLVAVEHVVHGALVQHARLACWREHAAHRHVSVVRSIAAVTCVSKTHLHSMSHNSGSLPRVYFRFFNSSRLVAESSCTCFSRSRACDTCQTPICTAVVRERTW